MAVTRAMSVAEMRSFVRSALDTDVTDLPNDLLDRYLIDGGNRIDAFTDSWTFREVQYTFATVADTQTYKLRNPDRNSAFDYDIARIIDVRGPTWSLESRPHQAARDWFSASSTTTGQPRWFTTWADRLYLWPTPSSAVNLSVSGYRDGIDWVGESATPDFPDEFHDLIATWGVSMAFAREGDGGMAAFYADRFNEELNRRSTSYLVRGTEGPLVMNGGFLGPNARRLGRPLFDWEL